MTCYIATSDPVFLEELKAFAELYMIGASSEGADILLLDMENPVQAPVCRRTVRFSHKQEQDVDFVRPFRYDQLAQYCSVLLQQSEDDEDAVLPGISLNGHLTATEERLLEALLEANGEAVSSAELSTAVFGEADRHNELKVYIRHLRYKIEEPQGIRIIETVRGVGYRIRSDRLFGKGAAGFLAR